MQIFLEELNPEIEKVFRILCLSAFQIVLLVENPQA